MLGLQQHRERPELIRLAIELPQRFHDRRHQIGATADRLGDNDVRLIVWLSCSAVAIKSLNLQQKHAPVTSPTWKP